MTATKSNALILFLALFFPIALRAQDEGADLLKYEQAIDHAVVAADILFLEKALAQDFKFKHGTGLRDTKESWIKSVGLAKGKYTSREIDSVEVEIHGKVGVTNGRLSVHRLTDKGEGYYIIKYIRVYVRNGKDWQMIMHRTVHQQNIK